MLGGLNNLYRMSLLLTADIRGFTTGLARAETRLLRFSGTVNKFGQSLNRGVGLAFGIVGAAAVQTAAEFDRANAILGQIVGKNSLQPLTDEAKRLGRETVFLAREASEAQLELAKLGFRADEINAVLGRSTKLATVFGTELDKTGRTIASTLRQFGLGLRGAEGLENVTEVADVMAVAFRESALDLDKFRESMKNVGPTARATGLDMYQTTALLAVLANNAVDGSLGGTKLRSTLSDLAKQFPDVADGLEKLNDQSLTYSDLVELLNKRAALVGAIFQDNGVQIEAFENALRNAGGAVDEMNEGLESKLFFQVEKLKNAFKAIGQELGDALAPTVESLAGSFESFARSLEAMDEKKLQTIMSVLAGAVGLAGASQVLGFIGITLGRIKKISGGFSRALVKNAGASATFARGLGPAVGMAVALAEAMGAIVKLTLGGEIAGFSFGDLPENAEEKAAKRAEERANRIKEARDRIDDERRRPSFTLEDLEDFTGVDNLEDANKLLTFYNGKIAESEGIMARLAESGREQGEFYQKHASYVDELKIETAALDRQVALLEEKKRIEAKEDGLELLREQNDAYKKQADELRALAEVTDQLRREQLKLVQSTEVPTVFGQNFMFDELTAAQQLVALLSGKGIKTAQEFANELERIEPEEDLFEDFTDPVDASTKAIEKLADKLIVIREGLEGVSRVAYEFADTLGQAFIQSRQQSVKFFDAFKESFNRAFQAVIGKLITLIALYTILAVVSGGATAAQGASFGLGFSTFTESNKLGNFLSEGFGIGTRSAASGLAINGEQGGLAQVAVRGAVSGNNLVILNQTGPRSVDRTFG